MDGYHVSDPVDHPIHYLTSGIECIDAIESATEGLPPTEAFCIGTAIKYLWRYRKKSRPIEDLQKAKWYIDRTINLILGHKEESNER